MSKKRTIDGFFKRVESDKTLPNTKLSYEVGKTADDVAASSTHPTYPFPVPQLRSLITTALLSSPVSAGKVIANQPDLNLVYYAPFLPPRVAHDFFDFLRDSLFFYRVCYTINRPFSGAEGTQIRTPRFTTVFGVDATAEFRSDGTLIDAGTGKPLHGADKPRYGCKPRPIPRCLDELRRATEAATGCDFNFCLVNYYASGSDSISYHSDDEGFLGKDPAIASFSLGTRRDFLMKHKPAKGGSTKAVDDAKPLKFFLSPGDMLLMRGSTQSKWLHSIPKRKGGECDQGRINITFRKALVKGGTENYYQYNVGKGEAYKWDNDRAEMLPWKSKV